MQSGPALVSAPSRRDFLRQTGGGFGSVALAGLLGLSSGVGRAASPLASGTPHFPARAKRIIFLFMEGAMSQVDTFEHKPALQAANGKTGPGGGRLVASKFRFARHGETGTWISELYPHVARHVDDLCFIRGLHTDTPAHPQAVIQLHTGAANAALTRPSLGSWLLYGLGTENENLPGYVAINPSPNFGGTINYGSAFLPAQLQGTRISDAGGLPNLSRAAPPGLQGRQLEYLQDLNRQWRNDPAAPAELDGIIASYELAFQLQDTLPRLLDLSAEPPAVLEEYGVKPGPGGSFARQCVMARRLCEAGVRFVEIRHPGWDHHNNLHKGLIAGAQATDQPTAALLADLKRRGLLADTLVLFGSEFGRLPTAQGNDGRDHNITGYPMWLAGAGVRAGLSYGATDEFGARAIDGRMHTSDLHATLLAIMGIDHERLTYAYGGRDFRLTDVSGRIVREIMT
jgi:hypothetical protein